MRLRLLGMALISASAFAAGPKYQKPDITVPQNWHALRPGTKWFRPTLS